MFNKKTLLILLFTFPLFLCMSPENSAHSSNSMDFVGKLVNFTVLFGGLFLILRKPIRNYLEQRIKKEDLSIKEAVETRNESEEKLNSALSRLDKLSERVRSIKNEAEQDGKIQKEKILESARQEADRLKDLSKQEIESIYASVMKELRAYAAEVTIEEATKRIKQRMTPKLQSAIIDKSIERLDKLNENSDSR
jgi:F-type H+-transporting ATPase subunit b